MSDGVSRRNFLKKAALGGVIVTTLAELDSPEVVAAPSETSQKSKTQCKTTQSNSSRGYIFLNADEADFVEAVVDHMVPADHNSPSGTALGINIYIDRALAGGWGKGHHFYGMGPWKPGHGQGYQLPMPPADLYRAGISASNRYCTDAYGKLFVQLSADQREQFLIQLSTHKVEFEEKSFAAEFFAILYQTVIEGMFADPIYGGNRDKAAWKMIGFPGVVAFNRQNIEKYRNKKFTGVPMGIADLS